MKYTAKQQRTIDYLTKLGDKTRLVEYKQRLKKRNEAKIAARKERKAKNAEAMKLVKVGDVFSCTWGYDQTNVDFFQVVALVGKNSVRVKQVCPVMVKDEATGPMAADRTYAINAGEMLPAMERSVFIKDQINGDVKRISDGCYRDEVKPCIKLSSFAWAYPEKPGLTKHYESWYA